MDQGAPQEPTLNLILASKLLCANGLIFLSKSIDLFLADSAVSINVILTQSFRSFSLSLFFS